MYINIETLESNPALMSNLVGAPTLFPEISPIEVSI